MIAADDGCSGKALMSVFQALSAGKIEQPPIVGAVASLAGLRAGLGLLAAAGFAYAAISATRGFRAIAAARPAPNPWTES